MSIPIADLHCDLLSYLHADPSRTPFDPQVKCSLPQLKAGPVQTQVMAVFCDTAPGSSTRGMEQEALFRSLQTTFGDLKAFLAIENGSSFFEEDEPFEIGLKRFQTISKPIYISLTWNGENRFGGGAHTKVGLKPDGKTLLDFLDGKLIAVDFSHASDALAYEIFHYIDQKNLVIPVLASHSNFRAVCDVPRNLPDDITKEIFRRKGVVGINFVKSFVGGEDVPAFSEQLEHGLELGGENQLCFGADFFFEGDVPAAYRKLSSFFPGYNEAGCYGKILGEWEQHGINKDILHKIAHGNLLSFLKKQES